VLLGEFAQQFGQARADEILRNAEPQPATQARAREIALGAVRGFDDRAGELRHGLAIGGQSHRMGVAREQAPSRRLFQFADVLTDR
jgi:hypothetical protein